ncbi:MAG: CDP-glycerol glycerophosphotransferase family protein [Wenzhouxiangella sp.]
MVLTVLKGLLSVLLRPFGANLVVFIETHPGSGSNVKALYLALCNDPGFTFECRLLRRDACGIFDWLRRECLLTRARWMVQDHGGRRSFPGQKVIELWHGIPIKTMGLMNDSDTGRLSRGEFGRLPDIMLSSSRVYETLLSACHGVPASRYRRYGFPRLRWLQTERALARTMLAEAIGEDLRDDQRIILWVPTHRKAKSNPTDQSRSVFCGLLEKYLDEGLQRALDRNNALLVIKPHPNDEPEAELASRSSRSRIKLLTSQAITRCADDLYEMLPGTDALLTDYSSIYLDYLLLDKPLGFILDDIEQYRAERGFLLEPVTNWLPGAHVHTKAGFVKFLDQIGRSEDLCKCERARVREVFYPDGLLDTAKLVREHIFSNG